MLAIIYNVSRWVPLSVTGCIHGFDCLFCGSEVTMYFVHQDKLSLSHAFFWYFLYVMMIIFTWVTSSMFFDGPFQVYLSPLTLFEEHNWGSFSYSSWVQLMLADNSTEKYTCTFFDQAKTYRQSTFLVVLWSFLFHWGAEDVLMHCISSICTCL